MKTTIIKSTTFLFLFLAISVYGQVARIQVQASAEEWKLYQIINEYRMQNGLEGIPFSASLTLVAKLHCEDLVNNLRYLTHGWSDCPFDAANSATYRCMWGKPGQLTNYKGYGYECIHGGEGGYQATAIASMEGWKRSQYHNDVIVNRGMWSGYKWNAIGVAIHGGYASIWFGVEIDPDGAPQ